MSPPGVAARVVAAAALAATACASAPPGPPGAFVAPGFTSDRLTAERVVVLPLGGIVLPPGLPPGDSLGPAIVRRVDALLAPGLVQAGAVGVAVGPDELAAVLVTLGPTAVARACAAAAAAGPDGRMDGPTVAPIREIAEAAGTRYVLIPRTLSLRPAGTLRFEAALDVDLVDASAGRVVWRETVRARPETPPTGDAADLAGAAMAAAAEDALQRTAVRITRLGRDSATE